MNSVHPQPLPAPAPGDALASTMALQAVTPPEPAAAPRTDALLGAVLAARYRVLERLGEGGMGAVYLAEHVGLRKRVAVKVLHDSLCSDREVVRRFEREAVAAAHLDHPNVAAATDFGQLPGGAFFLVMQYVEGRSLREVLEGPRLPPARALDLLGQVGAALTRAHGLGVVHRDLKPENVMVCARPGGGDLVKVLDFGIARVTAPELGGRATALTQFGSILGTPHYMAPEQALGQPVEAAADQYALGVLAFELFTGRRPFVSDEVVDLLRMHVGAPVPRVTEVAPGLPAALDAAVARMMAKRPAERFPSVAEAVDAMRAALDRAPVEPSAGPSPSPRALGVGEATPPPSRTPWETSPVTRLLARGRRALPHIAVPAAVVAGVVFWGLLLLAPLRSLGSAGAQNSGVPASPEGGHEEQSAPRPAPARRWAALRNAATCDELRDALAELAAEGPGPGAIDLARVRAGDCSMLARPQLCRVCRRGRE